MTGELDCPETCFAHVGSTIETVFSDGRKVRVTVNTPLVCAEANSLIMTGRWSVVNVVKTEERKA